MCCIFTWMAWCFDASHRVVVFFMACLISSSVCCLLLTASLAGVAMGYNYSLAEYIDLKETNISVYIKRGVYDDEIADDFDWRRSGGAEPSISLKDNTGLRMGPSVQQGEQPLAAGRRRSDNSIFESDEQNKYEGSLMRLTSTVAGQSARRFEPPEPPYTTPTSTTNIVDGLLQVADSMPGGSKERLKAIQAAARYHEAKRIELATAKVPDDPSGRIKAIEANAQIHNARRSDQDSTTTDKYAKYFGQLVQHPGFPGSGLSARKFMDSHDKDVAPPNPPNRFRDAVFRGQFSGWPAAGASKSTIENFFQYDMSVKPTMPTPPTIKPLLVRPIEGKVPKVMWDMKPKPEFKDWNDMPRAKLRDAVPKQGKVYNDYDDSQGLPLRRKRSDSKAHVNETNTIVPLLKTKITKYENLHTNKIDTELEISTNTGGKLLNEDNPSIEKFSTKFTHSNKSVSLKNNINTSELIVESISNNKSVFVKQSLVNSLKPLEYLTSLEKTKNVNWQPKKRRKKSEGYKYKKRESKQTKSVWWTISNGIQEQWNRIILYFNKRSSPILELSRNSTDNTNSSDDNKSTIINKLVAIKTKKLVGGNQFDTTETNNTRLLRKLIMKN